MSESLKGGFCRAEIYSVGERERLHLQSMRWAKKRESASRNFCTMAGNFNTGINSFNVQQIFRLFVWSRLFKAWLTFISKLYKAKVSSLWLLSLQLDTIQNRNSNFWWTTTFLRLYLNFLSFPSSAVIFSAVCIHRPQEINIIVPQVAGD